MNEWMNEWISDCSLQLPIYKMTIDVICYYSLWWALLTPCCRATSRSDISVVPRCVRPWSYRPTRLNSTQLNWTKIASLLSRQLDLQRRCSEFHDWQQTGAFLSSWVESGRTMWLRPYTTHIWCITYGRQGTGYRPAHWQTCIARRGRSPSEDGRENFRGNDI